MNRISTLWTFGPLKKELNKKRISLDFWTPQKELNENRESLWTFRPRKRDGSFWKSEKNWGKIQNSVQYEVLDVWTPKKDLKVFEHLKKLRENLKFCSGWGSGRLDPEKKTWKNLEHLEVCRKVRNTVHWDVLDAWTSQKRLDRNSSLRMAEWL